MSPKPTPLQVTTTPEMRARIIAIAERDEVSQAQVVRDVLEAGLAAREQQNAPQS